MTERACCYFHHTWREARRRQVATKAYAVGRAVFQLPALEDSNAVLQALEETARALLEDRIELKRAALVLFALQTASGAMKTANLQPYWREVVVDMEEEFVGGIGGGAAAADATPGGACVGEGAAEAGGAVVEKIEACIADSSRPCGSRLMWGMQQIPTRATPARMGHPAKLCKETSQDASLASTGTSGRGRPGSNCMNWATSAAARNTPPAIAPLGRS